MGLFDANGFEYHEGIVRTPLDCNECNKQFVARLNYDIDGNHKIICPNCGHVHWRVIQQGIVTDDRWGNGGGFVEATTERQWKDSDLAIETSSASQFIRKKWGIS